MHIFDYTTFWFPNLTLITFKTDVKDIYGKNAVKTQSPFPIRLESTMSDSNDSNERPSDSTVTPHSNAVCKVFRTENARFFRGSIKRYDLDLNQGEVHELWLQ